MTSEKQISAPTNALIVNPDLSPLNRLNSFSTVSLHCLSFYVTWPQPRAVVMSSPLDFIKMCLVWMGPAFDLLLTCLWLMVPSSFKHALVQPLHILDLITFKAPLGLTPSYTSNLLPPYDYYLLFSFMNWLSLLMMNDYNCCSALCKHCLLLLLLSWRLIYKHHFSPTSF